MSGIVNPPPWPSELRPRPSHGRHRRPEWVSDPVDLQRIADALDAALCDDVSVLDYLEDTDVECDHPITATVAGETHCLDCHADFREDL